MIEELKKILIRDEGNIKYAYKDSEGYLTIGVGRLIDKKKGGGISHEESMYLLDNDIKSVLHECDRAFDWFDILDEVRKTVVLSMVFNLGLPNFQEFKKTISFIERGMYVSASSEMLDSKWAEQVGDRAVRLSKMMLSGKY